MMFWDCSRYGGIIKSYDKRIDRALGAASAFLLAAALLQQKEAQHGK